MGRKPKAPVGVWRKTKRKINGEKRWVKVKRNSDGSETVRVLYPKNKGKDIGLDEKATELTGIAKGKYLNAKRSDESKESDKNREAKKEVRNTNEGIIEWAENPNLIDLNEVDEKR